MNDEHDHLDSELQRLIRGCPEPERLSDERRRAIWQVMAARLEPTSVGNRRAQTAVSPAVSTPATRPSMADEAIRRIQQAEIAPGIAGGRHRLMHSRALRWAVPVAAAAGVLLAVGLWPDGSIRNGEPQSGRVYAFSEVPALVRSARTFHIHGVQRWIMAGKVVELPIDTWHSASGAYRSIGTHVRENGVDLPDIVCDGQYQMTIDHVNKSASFKRVTPLQTRIVFLAEMQNMLFGNLARREGLARTGMETIDGRTCEVWQREETFPRDNVVTARFNKYWFDPSTGVLVRAEVWAKDKYSGQFRQCFLLDKMERSIELPAGIFDTTPPADYKPANTKETAPLDSFSHIAYMGPTLESVVHAGFVLPDGSVVMPWSVRELGKDEPQDGLFAGLVAGGELPKLPIEIYGLEPQGQTKLTYLGRHLAWTRKDGRYFEWALYVPDKNLPDPISFLTLLTRPNPAGRELEGNDSPSYPPCAIEVTADDFDELVLGAMAELSDNGLRPEQISLQSVLQLADAIRRSLPGAAADEAAPARSGPN